MEIKSTKKNLRRTRRFCCFLFLCFVFLFLCLFFFTLTVSFVFEALTVFCLDKLLAPFGCSFGAITCPLLLYPEGGESLDEDNLPFASVNIASLERNWALLAGAPARSSPGNASARRRVGRRRGRRARALQASTAGSQAARAAA